MDMVLDFDREEYDMIIKLLGLVENPNENAEDDTDYFNAWNFGQSENDYRYFTHSSTGES